MSERSKGQELKEVCWNRNPPMNCQLPLGHPGRHECTCCGRTWENEAETRPCPSTALAVLAVLQEGGVRVRCGLLIDHDGPHRFGILWTEEAS